MIPPEPDPDPPTPTTPKFTYTSMNTYTGLGSGTKVYSGVKLNGNDISATIGNTSVVCTQLINYLPNSDNIWYVANFNGGVGIDFANPRATSGYYGYCMIDYDDGAYELVPYETGAGMVCSASAPSDLISVIASGVFDVEQE